MTRILLVDHTGHPTVEFPDYRISGSFKAIEDADIVVPIAVKDGRIEITSPPMKDRNGTTSFKVVRSR